jgi:uncharacterized membrane protein
MMHVMVMVMPMMMVVVVVVMMHFRRHRSGGRRSGFLRDGVAGEAERERGGGGKGLDHGKIFLWLGEPGGSRGAIWRTA